MHEEFTRSQSYGKSKWHITDFDIWVIIKRDAPHPVIYICVCVFDFTLTESNITPEISLNK